MAASKVLVVRLPPWVSEEEARRAIEGLIARLGGRLSVEEVRALLGVTEDELRDDVEAGDYDVAELRRRERERLP